MFVAKKVSTSKINSEFDGQKKLNPLAIEENINSEMLKSVSEETQLFFNELEKVSPDAYKNFSMGEYQADGFAEVDVQGYGLAYGLTNRLTVYGSIPYYSASVKVNIQRKHKGNLKNVNKLIQSSNNQGGNASYLSQLVEQLPDANENLLQSVFVNLYEYEPVGDWRAKGFGDMELGMIYRLTEWKDAGLATSFGAVLPTGREDNPDIIQDIPFGDGQTDIWAEFGGGFHLFDKFLHFWQSTRYTHQLPTNKELRVQEDRDLILSEKKANFTEKLGDIIDLRVGLDLSFFNSLKLGVELGHREKAQDSYQSDYSDANQVLAYNSEVEIRTLKTAIEYSTIEKYKSGDFFLPFKLGFSMEQMLEGKNTANYTRYDVDLSLFF